MVKFYKNIKNIIYKKIPIENLILKFSENLHKQQEKTNRVITELLEPSKQPNQSGNQTLLGNK